MEEVNRLLFKFSTTSKKSSVSRILHVKPARYATPLPHTLIHYDDRISIINLLVVLTCFKLPKKLEVWMGISTTPLQSTNGNTSKARRDQSTSLLPLELGEGGSEEGIYSGQILIYTKITTCVPPHQDHPRRHLIKTARDRWRHAIRAPFWGHISF